MENAAVNHVENQVVMRKDDEGGREPQVILQEVNADKG
jgi:hypothetical protein